MVARDALAVAADRVKALTRDWDPPAFAHVPDADAAVFLCAVDHKTGYSEPHLVGSEGPLEGSELMWALGLKAARLNPGLLSAKQLRYVSAGELADWFRAGDEPIGDPERRAALWRDLASGLEQGYEGSATELLASCGEKLGGPGGLLARLRPFRAYEDPLAKKAFLFGKIAERRGWLSVSDPEVWEVSADNVLMRLALRSGLVEPGTLAEVRSDTRSALKELAALTGLSPPVLDDLLWELGRNDADLLGRAAGDLSEPPRDPAIAWY